MKYTDIFIDFDDTLYDTYGNANIALAETYTDFGLGQYFENAKKFYDDYWETNVSLWNQYSKGEITRDFLIEERFRKPLSKGKGLEVTTSYCMKISDYFLDKCATKTGVVEGAYELLEYLKRKGYKLHICSNGFHEVQYKKLSSAKMKEYFENVILSEDAGANKPSPLFFEYALNRTGAQKDKTIMIGDNYNTDITGAMNFGLDTIFFNRWSLDYEHNKPATFMVTKLKEIIDIL